MNDDKFPSSAYVDYTSSFIKKTDAAKLTQKLKQEKE